MQMNSRQNIDSRCLWKTVTPKVKMLNWRLTYLIVSQRNFAPAFGTTADVAIVADVSDAIRKLCFEANVTSCVQFHARLLLLFRLLPDRVDQGRHLVLLPPVNTN